MAFNPFHRFRKHQRVILAVVTIALMLVFGLTWGMGDVTRMLSGPTANSGQLVTNLKFSSSTFSTQTKVWESDVEKENRRRALADEFIRFVVGHGSFDAMQQMAPARKPFEQVDPTKVKYPAILADFITRREERINPNPFMAQFRPPPSARERLDEIQRDMQRVASLRQNPLPFDKDATAKSSDFVSACDTLLAALRFELWVTEQEQERLDRGDKYAANLYFGGTRTLDDTLDFMLWKHQADRLGITYAEADVRKGLNRLIGVGESFAATGTFVQNPLASQFFKNRNRNQDTVSDHDLKELTEALADEFRVQTAQQALLGIPSSSPGAFFVTSGIHQAPISVTPDEFLVYVRDKRTTLKLALLTVPTKNFLKSAEPLSEEQSRALSERYRDQLQELFNDYRGTEPAPDRKDPAFKIPRMVSVHYATADPESAFYKEVAKKNLVLAPQMLRFGSIPLTLPAGGGVGWIGSLGAPLYYDAMDEEYESYREQKQREVRLQEAVSPAVYDRSYNAAATVGEILGSLQQTGVFAVSLTIVDSNIFYDTVAAQAAGAFAIVATQPSPLTLGSLTIYPPLNSVQPRKLVESTLRERLDKVAAERQVGENLAALYKEFAKPGMTADKAKEYLEKTGREVNLQFNGMTAPKDRYGLNDDPALKPFKDDYPRWRDMRKRDLPPNTRMPEFADYLLSNHGTYRPDYWVMTPPKGLHIYWLAEDKPAHEISFAEARPKVLDAYLQSEARSNALGYVKELLEKELKDHKWPDDSATREKEVKSFLESRKQGRVFDLDKVSRLWTPESLPNFGTERPYYGYSPPEADYPNPPVNLVDRLMTLQKPGDAVYLKDRPEKNFYVAVLLERSVPTLEDFKKIYENADNFLQRDPLWDTFVRERRQEFQKQFIQRLREEGTGELDDKGRVKVSPEVRAKFDKTEGG